MRSNVLDVSADAVPQDLTTASEKSEIHLLCETSLKRLPVGDRSLPQILRLVHQRV